MHVEVKTYCPSLSQLRQVVIERFLADPNFVCSLFKRQPPYLIVLICVTIIKFPPLRHLLHNICNRSLLSFLLVQIWSFNGLAANVLTDPW